jgi:hypothetical protein
MNIRPISRTKLLVMCLATGGLWSVVWFRQVSKIIKGTTEQRQIKPALQAFQFGIMPVVIAAIAIGSRTMGFYIWQPSEHPVRVAICVAVALLSCLIAAPAIYRLVGPQLSAMREAAGGLIYVRTPAVTTAVFIVRWLTWLLPNPFRFIGFSTVFPVLTVQLAVNQYLDNLDIHTEEDARLSAFEILVALLCGSFLLWALGGAMKSFVESFSPTSGPPGV